MNSTDAANPENPGRLAPHGGCNWDGCKTCNPDGLRKTDKRVRRHIKHVNEIERRNAGKLVDWVTSSDMSGFVSTKWGNLQIDPLRVRVGDSVLLALKEEVIIGSHRHRLIARYSTMKVRSPEECWEDDMQHAMSVCTQCIHDSWLWDYLFRNVRTLPNFAHGTARAYDYFGCRCDQCTLAHSAYLVGTLDRDGAPVDHGLGEQKILAQRRS